MIYTWIYRGLMMLYGLYVLLTEAIGTGRLVRHTANRILLALFVLAWLAWLFVSFQVPYGWGHDTVTSRLGEMEPSWLRSGMGIGWMILTLGELVLAHLLYRSRRAGDGLVALVLLILLAWIISPLNSLYNFL